MASGWYNRGKKLWSEYASGRTTKPSNFYFALVTASYTPDADHATWATPDGNEIAAGNGYTQHGQAVAASNVGFDASSQDDSGDTGEIQLADIVWTASGGDIPASGGGARYLIMMDDNATETSRELIAYFDLGSDKTTSVSLTLQDFALELA